MQDLKPGDLVEIDTGKGLAYVLVTHEHASYPPVVRALSGLHDSRPDDVAALAEAEARFTVMIPLAGALRKLGLEHEVVAQVDLSDTDFPTFRMPIRDKQGNIVYWWFWDGQGLTYDIEPGAERDTLPLREVTSAGRFLEMLTGGAA